MSNFFERKQEMEDAIKRYSNDKLSKRLKYWALVSIALCILLLILTIVLIHILSATLLLLIRGFVGLFAIIFVILMAIFLYRIHHSYWKDRNN